MKRRVLNLSRHFAWVIGACCLTLSTQMLIAQSSSLRVGVVGLVHGHVAGFMQGALNRKDIEIVGIVEGDTALAAEFRTRYHVSQNLFYRTPDEMLERQRPEAVVVFTNTFDHRSVVETCCRQKIHVMMEKPLAVSFDAAKAIARSAQNGNIIVLVNYETTWYPNSREIYRIIHQNRLGEIRKMVAHDGHRGPKEIGVGPEFLSWLTDPALNGGGALMDFGCYGANLLTWLMDNQRPGSVTAVTQHLKPHLYPRVDDEATIILTYPHAQGIIQASWNWPAGRKDLEIYGETASVLSAGRDVVRLRLGDNPEQELSSAPLGPPEDDPISYLKAVVRGQVHPSGLSSLENNLIVTEILDAARRSAETGQTVQLPVDGALQVK